MDFNSVIENIDSREDFINFLDELRRDKEQRSKEWQNKEITSYLEGICSWVEDMNGYYKNMNIDKPLDINWKFIAVLFYVGKIYE